MPTGFEFERASGMFLAAADEVGAIAGEVDGIEVSGVIIGGSLGRQVPAALTSAATTLHGCVASLHSAAELCASRAAIIAAYEAQLARYEELRADYLDERREWHQRKEAWENEEEGATDPGWGPMAPRPPSPPPEWADVRRLGGFR